MLSRRLAPRHTPQVARLLRVRTTTSKPPTTTPDSNPLVAEEAAALEFLSQRGKKLGFNLTLTERKLILKEATKDGGLTAERWEKLVSPRSLASAEQLTLTEYLTKSHDLHLGQSMLKNTARLGVAFFAMTGAHTAGEANMHVMGATLTGCITALGGGTFNNLVMGVAPVGWVKDPTFLLITVGASLVGFYAWPLIESFVNDDDNGDDKEDVVEDGIANIPSKLPTAPPPTPNLVRYSLESVALGSLAVIGAQQGIVRGLHPLVSSSMGVTIALGGVVRDLMCKRDLSLSTTTGCQSYGVASFGGAAAYVALRQLHVWNCDGCTVKLVKGGIPIGLRILVGFGTVFGIRAWALTKPGGIFLSMDENAKNFKRIITQEK
ncbi:hypothetical protein TrLO_g3467 [Triparma laevis f. longispina]|uniref:Glycine transporter domain-containing protein n=1 Tax=Triparma laevis f. longispina TaxID=1714387 RepID=A0A9W6ZC49_9STRA|nr:hypothetical protein TrLO_g3467 [Triparma laevis f. longispina]